jgi:MoaA/NifB/PqqE/SkfB family radical SAM enzyme
MQRISDIRTVHIELTDKCQAQCPMCARNYHGGPTRSFIRNSDISIEQFKEWFPREFLAQLNNFYSCGNYGDPAFARDCLEIYAYVRECNPRTKLAIHTNGGMRNPDWWRKLAKYNVEVIFAVDGVKGTHELYRKNVKYEKVIENLTAFVKAGGKARVDSLVFAHNENDVDELERYILSLGVKSVNFVSTTRFYEMKEYEVLDNSGNVEYTIKPAQSDRFKQIPNNSLEQLLDKDFRDAVIEEVDISPKCMSEKGIYVDPHGDIFPCCWIGGDYLEEPILETLPIHKLRNLSVHNTKEALKVIGVVNCRDKVLWEDDILFKQLSEYWYGEDKCMTCARQCSTMMFQDNNKYKRITT